MFSLPVNNLVNTVETEFETVTELPFEDVLLFRSVTKR